MLLPKLHYTFSHREHLTKLTVWLLVSSLAIDISPEYLLLKTERNFTYSLENDNVCPKFNITSTTLLRKDNKKVQRGEGGEGKREKGRGRGRGREKRRVRVQKECQAGNKWYYIKSISSNSNRIDQMP